MTLEIHEKGKPAEKVTCRDVEDNVDKVQKTIASVKEHFKLSLRKKLKKTKYSLLLFICNGMNRLIENTSSKILCSPD